MVCAAVSCGLSEDPRDESLKHQYITLSDPSFEAYCMRVADVNGDGRLSRYEARQMRHIDCSDSDVKSLWEIGEFINITTLDCSGNAIPQLRLEECTRLRRIDCSRNGLETLEVDNLRMLVELRCSDNRLKGLSLHTNSSLRYLDCHRNLLRHLNVAGCAPQIEGVDATQNPLEVFYKGSAQSIGSLKLDDYSVVEEQ